VADMDYQVASSRLDSEGPNASDTHMGIARIHFDGWGLLVLPALVFLLVFFVLPIALMIWRSFTDPGISNYVEFFTTPLYARVLWITIRTSVIITGLSLVLGYPYAYVMVKAGGGLAAILGALVLLPFWSSILVRTYAWTVMLQDRGVVNSALMKVGLIAEPLSLMYNNIGVTIGMTHILLPFMVLPIYAVMRRIDSDLVPAAQSLGARPTRAFLRVFAPLSVPGVLAGSLIVFVLSLGFYITPALLGSPTQTMYSVLVANEVQKQLQFGVGSALGAILLVVTLVFLAVGSRVVNLGAMLGSSTGGLEP